MSTPTIKVQCITNYCVDVRCSDCKTVHLQGGRNFVGFEVFQEGNRSPKRFLLGDDEIISCCGQKREVPKAFPTEEDAKRTAEKLEHKLAHNPTLDGIYTIRCGGATYH